MILEVKCCHFDGGSWNYFLCVLFCIGPDIPRRGLFCAVLLLWCRSWPRLSYMFKMLSVNWYARNRIMHVHPVWDSNSHPVWDRNSQCRLGAARHSTNVLCLAGPVCIELSSDKWWTCQILYVIAFYSRVYRYINTHTYHIYTILLCTRPPLDFYTVLVWWVQHCQWRMRHGCHNTPW